MTKSKGRKSKLRSARLAGTRKGSAAFALSTEAMWAGLEKRPPARLRRIVPEAVPDKVLLVVAKAAGIERDPRIRVAWQRVRAGTRLYCLETDVGTYRVVHSSWGWRADEIPGEHVFVKEPGVPIDPRTPSERGESRFGELKRHEISDAVWNKIKGLFAPVGGVAPERGAVKYSHKAVLNGIVYRLRHNLDAWADIPLELGYGQGSTLWRRLRSWEAAGIWDEVRAALEELLPDGKEFDWPSLEPGEGDGLNHRQRALFADAVQHEELVLSVTSYARDYETSYETARTDLTTLVEQGLVLRRRNGRNGWAFEVVRDPGGQLERTAGKRKGPSGSQHREAEEGTFDGTLLEEVCEAVERHATRGSRKREFVRLDDVAEELEERDLELYEVVARIKAQRNQGGEASLGLQGPSELAQQFVSDFRARRQRS